MLPFLFKETAYLQLFGISKIPLIFFLSPRVVEITDKKIDIMIPLNYRSKNHWGTMYFGALCIGADCAGGLLAMKLINTKYPKISLVFKDFKADFLKRPDSNVHFICEDGDLINSLVQKAAKTGERENAVVKILAFAPKTCGKDPVAKFELTLSLKSKG